MTTPENLRRIEEIYHQALDLPISERASFLEKVCETADVRREVESLLGFDEKPNDFIDDPLGKFAPKIFSETGKRKDSAAAHYKLLSLLGGGGMGEVFLAEDPALNRKVALKFLPEKYTGDAERQRRFEIEAKSISAINHPNIVTIYQIGTDKNRHFIATEYIEGETLREFITSTKPGFDKIIDIAIQVTSALEAAHKQGIIHRDIKPENIMIRPDGLVKVLDFGVAKLIEESEKETGDGRFETAPGRVIGTKSYMSPEQALGKAIDARSDIFSFGVVLYELATGALPFPSNSDAEFYDALLNSAPEPPLNFNPKIPGAMEEIIGRALEKDADLRYQTVSDLRAELLRLKRDTLSGSGIAAGQNLPKRLKGKKRFPAAVPVAFAAALILVVSVISYLSFAGKLSGGNAAPKMAAEYLRLTEQSGTELYAQLSPDGKTLYYSSPIGGKWNIYSQRVGGKNAVNLTVDSQFDDTQPAISPDGELVAFRSERGGGGIFVMGASGESVRRVTDSGYYPAWSPDGKEIVFCQDNFFLPEGRSIVPSALWAVDVATGKKRIITGGDAVQPNWSPNGSRIAFWGINSGGFRNIFTVAANGQSEPVKVTDNVAFNWNPVWSPDGKYLYYASDANGTMSFWRVPIDEKTGTVSGEAETIVTPSTHSQHLSFSADGRLMAYVSALKSKNIFRIGFDPEQETVTGGAEPLTSGSRSAAISSVSGNGNSIAFSSFGDKVEDIFVMRGSNSDSVQLTNDEFKDRAPVLSPDGRKILFFSDRTGTYQIWVINSDGSGLRQLTKLKDSEYAQFSLWSPDGKRVLVNRNGKFPIIIDPEKEWENQTPEEIPPYEDPNSYVLATSWSPDGKKLIGHMRSRDKSVKGIFEYSFETKNYRIFSDFGDLPSWLNDSRRAIFTSQNKLFLLDTAGGEIKELKSTGNNSFDFSVITRDNRYIYYALDIIEADIWLAKFQ